MNNDIDRANSGNSIDGDRLAIILGGAFIVLGFFLPIISVAIGQQGGYGDVQPAMRSFALVSSGMWSMVALLICVSPAILALSLDRSPRIALALLGASAFGLGACSVVYVALSTVKSVAGNLASNLTIEAGAYALIVGFMVLTYGTYRRARAA